MSEDQDIDACLCATNAAVTSQSARACQRAQPAYLTPEVEAQLRAAINPAYVGVRGTESWERSLLLAEIDRLRATAALVALSDERVDFLADTVTKGMPEGLLGFCKVWGWRHFARALLAACAGHTWAPPPRASWPDVLRLVNEYALNIADAAQHQSSSRADIAQSAAAKALVKLRVLFSGPPSEPPDTNTGATL